MYTDDFKSGLWRLALAAPVCALLAAPAQADTTTINATVNGTCASTTRTISGGTATITPAGNLSVYTVNPSQDVSITGDLVGTNAQVNALPTPTITLNFNAFCNNNFNLQFASSNGGLLRVGPGAEPPILAGTFINRFSYDVTFQAAVIIPFASSFTRQPASNTPAPSTFLNTNIPGAYLGLMEMTFKITEALKPGSMTPQAAGTPILKGSYQEVFTVTFSTS